MLDVTRPASSRESLKRQVVRQACDACRTRKARCETNDGRSPEGDSSQEATRTSSCQRCARLGLNCTYRMPFGIRGPRRKTLSSTPTLASPDSLKGLHTANPISPPSISAASSSSNANDAAGTASPLYLIHSEPARPNSDAQQWPTLLQGKSHQRSSIVRYTQPSLGDELCPRNLLKQILADYLEYLYVLIPIVHRPTFHRNIRADKDLYDEDFSGLILGLCAATVGTMPNRFNEYTTCATPLRFGTRTEMIQYCHLRILGLRGSDYFEEINFNKWAASYLMCIALFQIGEHNQARMVEVESMQLARLLGLHQIADYKGLNCIEMQLRKKAFWLTFYGYVHTVHQNLRKERLTYLDANILASIDLEQLMPLEVDDEHIFEHTVLTQPTGVLSVVVGFNTASRLFWTALRSPTEKSDGCYCERSRTSIAQYHYLKARLHDLHYMLDGLPPQLRQWQSARGDSPPYVGDPEESRILRAQFATTRANVHVTHLWLQSIILDQVDALLSNTATCEILGLSVPDHGARWVEREHICRQLLHVLYSIAEAHIEPNGNHLTYKVRDVAVGLFTCPFGPHTEAGKRASEYLQEFADKLSNLDGSEMPNTTSLQSWIDTDRTYMNRTH